MVTTIFNKFLGRLKKESTAKVSDPVRDTNGENNSSSSGIDIKKIDLVAFVDFVVRSLVDHPEEVTIDTENEAGGLIIRVSCNKDEIRKIIGKNGKTINAIRALVKGAAKRISQSVTILVVD